MAERIRKTWAKVSRTKCCHDASWQSARTLERTEANRLRPSLARSLCLSALAHSSCHRLVSGFQQCWGFDGFQCVQQQSALSSVDDLTHLHNVYKHQQTFLGDLYSPVDSSSNSYAGKTLLFQTISSRLSSNKIGDRWPSPALFFPKQHLQRDCQCFHSLQGLYQRNF